MKYYYNPEVKYLLISQPIGDVQIKYANDKRLLTLPIIGKRPPFYTNPIYRLNFPVI